MSGDGSASPGRFFPLSERLRLKLFEKGGRASKEVRISLGKSKTFRSSDGRTGETRTFKNV
jgi:hypothetical protein